MKRTLIYIMAAMLLMGGMGCKKQEGAKSDVFKDVPLETVLESIYTEAALELPDRATTAITQENMAYYLGVDGIEYTEAIASEALINVIPFSLCLVRVADPEKAEETARTIAENANPNKWVCVGVSSEHVATDYVGDVVMLVMADQSNELLAAFKRLAKG